MAWFTGEDSKVGRRVARVVADGEIGGGITAHFHPGRFQAVMLHIVAYGLLNGLAFAALSALLGRCSVSWPRVR